MGRRTVWKPWLAGDGLVVPKGGFLLALGLRWTVVPHAGSPRRGQSGELGGVTVTAQMLCLPADSRAWNGSFLGSVITRTSF